MLLSTGSLKFRQLEIDGANGEILWRFIKYEWIELDAYKSWTHLVNYVENVLQNFGEKYKIIFV